MRIIASGNPRLAWGIWLADGALALCVLPTAVGALALALRLYGLGDKPFWLDEISSFRRAADPVPALVADSLHSSHYPSYFLLLWLVAQIGTSQWLLRLPSAVFGALGASLTCAIGSKAAGARSGAIAGLLMAFSPFDIQLGQEARSYTLASCLILTALLGLLRLAQNPAAAACPVRRSGSLRGAWLVYCFGTAAALNVLNVAVPWLVASNLGALAIAWRADTGKRAFLRNWGLAQLVVLVTWLPSLACVYLVSKGELVHATGWAPAVTAKALWSTLAPVYLLRISRFITVGLFPTGVPVLAIIGAALALLGMWRLRRDPPTLGVIGTAALLPGLGLSLFSLIVPIMVPRYFAWSAAPFFILAGAGVARFAVVPFAAIATALATACLINLMPYYGYETKPRWDLVAADLVAAAQPGDVVLLDNYYSYLVLSFFTSRAGLNDARLTFTWNVPEAAEAAPGHDVWAVYGRTGQGAEASPDAFRRKLASLGQPMTETPVGRYIVLWHFRAAAKPVS